MNPVDEIPKQDEPVTRRAPLDSATRFPVFIEASGQSDSQVLTATIRRNIKRPIRGVFSSLFGDTSSLRSLELSS